MPEGKRDKSRCGRWGRTVDDGTNRAESDETDGKKIRKKEAISVLGVMLDVGHWRLEKSAAGGMRRGPREDL